MTRWTLPDRESLLGRLVAPDERDFKYPMRAVVDPAPTDLRYRYYGGSWWGDQGHLPHCVGFAWAHWLEGGPHPQPGIPPIVNPDTLYAEAQKVDEWPGEDYEGTSVRAGAKVLQALGYVTAYHWAWGIVPVLDALLTAGPVVVGTNWYANMFLPTEEGRLVPGGPVLGGHAYMLDGINIDKGRVRIKNSWGRDWGKRGRAWLAIEDLQRLIQEDGEACLAIEATPEP